MFQLEGELEMKGMIQMKKEQFAVEIRKKKNDLQIQKNRQMISLGFNELIEHQYETTQAAKIYEQVVREYSQQNELCNIMQHDGRNLLSEQEFYTHLANIENYSSQIPYQFILRSLIFVNAFLRLNNMSRINISQKMIESLSDICISYKEQQTPENFYLSIMALQSISVISYFPINVIIFSDKLLKTLFTWVDCRITQLECNSYQALYLVSCSDEQIMQKLITQYNLVDVSLNTLQKLITRLKALSPQNNNQVQSRQTEKLEEMTKELMLLILKIIQECHIVKKREGSSSLKINEQILSGMIGMLRDYQFLNNSSGCICTQIIKSGINCNESAEQTINSIIDQNVISIFYEIIEKYIMNFTESKSYQQMVEIILNIICTISSHQDQRISQCVYQSDSNLKTLVELLIKERNNININSIKIMHNICLDSPSAILYFIEDKSFWDNLIILTDYSNNSDLIKEILLLMCILFESLTKPALDLFMKVKGIKIFQAILSKFQLSNIIIIVYTTLSLILNFMIENRLVQTINNFIKQCNSHQIIQLAEFYSTNQHTKNNVQNSINYFMDLLEQQTDSSLRDDIPQLNQSSQLFCYNPAQLIYQNYN